MMEFLPSNRLPNHQEITRTKFAKLFSLCPTTDALIRPTEELKIELSLGVSWEIQPPFQNNCLKKK